MQSDLFRVWGRQPLCAVHRAGMEGDTLLG